MFPNILKFKYKNIYKKKNVSEYHIKVYFYILYLETWNIIYVIVPHYYVSEYVEIQIFKKKIPNMLFISWF